MVTSTQQKLKTPNYTGLETDGQYGTDRVVPVSPTTTGSSTTALIAIIALAIVAAIGYFYFADGAMPVNTTSTPPVTSQDIAPTPVPADPVPVEPAPAAPLQNTPPPAPVAPAN
jgi:uncharacterized RDD family membrane protein YckC